MSRTCKSCLQCGIRLAPAFRYKFIGILQRLLDEGEFDEAPINMPWGTQHAFGPTTNTNTTSGETDEKKEVKEEIL
jgi:hypothetical protein